MPGPADTVPWDALSVGATRPAVIKGLNVPFWFVLPIGGIPMAVVAATAFFGDPNPWWIVLIAPLTGAARWLVAKDHNRPRVLFLALVSGAMFADRKRWGGYTADPLGEVRYVPR